MDHEKVSYSPLHHQPLSIKVACVLPEGKTVNANGDGNTRLGIINIIK